MTRAWKPGDVALAQYCGEAPRVYVYGRKFGSGGSKWVAQDGMSTSNFRLADWWRLLVVIDPENREQVERLDAAIRAAFVWKDGASRDNMSLLQAALREFADPKPSEPTDPTARVSDHRENIWRLLADGDWVCTSGPDIGEYLTWARLMARGPLAVEVTP